MNRRERNIKEMVDKHLGLFQSPPLDEMERAEELTLHRLRTETPSTPKESLAPSHPVRPAWRLRWAVAVIAVTVLISMAILWQGRAPGVLESAQGARRIRFGEIVSNGGAGAVLSLRDGSRVEMRSKSELALEAADDGVRIRLNGGTIIVTAAKQRNGHHLYVQTKDVTVSVVGTVFLVNAEKEGSRVAVIQGEVHVQLGPVLRKLHSGDQVATGPEMAAMPVGEEIAWSREAPAHMAVLQLTPAVAPQRELAFAAESIRPHSGLSPNGQESIGFVCHGIDGVRRAGSEYISGVEGRMVAPQGRCVGKGVLLASLIAFAYEVPPRDVSNLPDWAVAPDSPMNIPAPPVNAFQIEAVAEDPSTATAEQLVQMVQTMLAKRFKLKVRREPKEVPGYALVVAKDGPKPGLKEVSGAEELPCQDINSAGQPMLRGRSRLDKLALWLSGYLGCLGGVSAPVVDKTELKGIYEYEFVTVGGGGIGGPRGGPPQGQAPRMRSEVMADSRKQVAANMSALLEEHLGLRLQAEKAIPVEGIVIEQVEKPSPN